MTRPWRTPSHRNQNHPQVEFCDFCGAMVAAQDRIQGTAEGFRGYWVCKEHAKLALTPSFNDLGGIGNAMPSDAEDTAPHSGLNWVNEDSDW